MCAFVQLVNFVVLAKTHSDHAPLMRQGNSLSNAGRCICPAANTLFTVCVVFERLTNFLMASCTFAFLTQNIIVQRAVSMRILQPNSPGPLTDNWKLTDDSSVNFHDMFFFIFCYNLSKNEEKHVMEIYGRVVRNFPVVCKWTR